MTAPGHGEVASSDKAFNMICMRRDIYSLWRKAHIALKWVGEDNQIDEKGFKTFIVRWDWMPDRLVDRLNSQVAVEDGCNPPGLVGNANVPAMRREVDLDTEEGQNAICQALVSLFETPNLDSRASLQDPGSSILVPKATVRDENGRLIETGRLFKLKVQAEDIQKTKILIDAQWLVMRMAAISGAGEAPDDLQWEMPPRPRLQGFLL